MATSANSTRSRILLESGTNELEVIVFFLCYLDGGHKVETRYGINAGKVKELVAMPETVTAVPGGASSVKGVFLLRDRTITLVDLAEWFGFQPVLDEEVRRRWTVVVSEIYGKDFGFITHGVDKVHRVSWTDVKAPPPLIAASHSITGICLLDEIMVQMVDFEHIVSELDPSVRMELPSEGEGAAGDAAGKTVVIADDSGMILRSIQKNLEQAGYKVLPFHDGQETWDYLVRYRNGDTAEGPIAAVITDIEMPRMDGHHLCASIKEDAVLRRLPVILFSSMITDALRHKGEEVGADDQITKPEIGRLVERLQACIAAAESG